MQKHQIFVKIIFYRRNEDFNSADGFCQICLIPVDEKAKHCRRCQRCISGFDHHCDWLNLCIGDKNYIFFIIFLNELLLLNGLLLVLYFISLLDWIFKEKRNTVIFLL